MISIYIHLRFLRFFSFGINMGNSSSNLNYQQIHLVHLSKLGPIPKPVLLADEYKPLGYLGLVMEFPPFFTKP